MTRYYRLLGTLEIEVDGRPSDLAKNTKGCALISYLIITGQPQSRETLADSLWDAGSIARSKGNLRSMLNRIHELAPELSITRKSVSFKPGSDTYIDLVKFNEALDSKDLANVNSGLHLYRGDLLANLHLDSAPRFDEWLLVTQEQLRVKVLTAYERLCRAYRDRGQLDKAMNVARRWVALDTLNEEALRQLMTLLALNGLADSALKQYEANRQVIWRELELEPEPATTNLLEKIRAGEFNAQPRRQDILKDPGETRQFNWDETPLVGPFFGRSDELTKLRRWLVHDRSQVVAIYGIGGVGKTTLSARAIRNLADNFEAIIWRSLLNAPLFDELLPAFLRTLSTNTLEEIPANLEYRFSLLLEILRSKRCLLVLDNVETIMNEESAGTFRRGYEEYGLLLQYLAQQEHQSTLLITSRERPVVFDRLTYAGSQVRDLELGGLEIEDSLRLLTRMIWELAAGLLKCWLIVIPAIRWRSN